MARAGNRAKVHFLKNVDLSTIMEPANPSEVAFTGSKVIITIGPACQDVDTLCQLLESGATCARIDLTWGTLQYHKQSLTNLQKAMQKTRKLCAIMIDSIGREIFINRDFEVNEKHWPIPKGTLSIKKDRKVIFTGNAVNGSSGEDAKVQVSYPKFAAMCEKGDTIFVGRYLVTGSEDSSVYLTVDETTETDVICTASSDVQLAGMLTVFHTERSADGLANVQNDLPVLMEEDKASIQELAKEFEVDFISLSFTRSAGDIEHARDFLDSIGLQTTKIVAKCETRKSLFEFQEIAQRSDGVILSRGNLGLDVLPEKMALVQKSVISNCTLMGKPVLVTRVVDTMISAPRPTRAEATDVANAVLDGCDGILLGAETLRGKYPVATVQTILHICKQAERCFDHKHHFEHLMSEAEDAMEGSRRGSAQRLPHASSDTNLPADLSGANGSRRFSSTGSISFSQSSRSVTYLDKLESLASSAVRSSDKVGAKLIIVFTQSGTTARLVSKYRPPVPILTLVVPTLSCKDRLSWQLSGKSCARQCLIQRGLLPCLASEEGESLLSEAVGMCVRDGLLHAEDHVVVVQKANEAFMIKIITVDPHGAGIASIRPQSLIDMMKNAHAAKGGQMDEETAKYIEEQLSAKHSSPVKQLDRRTSLLPGANYNPKPPPSEVNQEPVLGNGQTQKEQSKISTNGAPRGLSTMDEESK